MSEIDNPSRVCLLTGAGGALGTALCKAMDRKYLVSAVYRSKPPDVDTQDVQYINPLDQDPATQPTTFAIKADLLDEGEIGRVVELTLAKFGRIDLLINNAGKYVVGPMVSSEILLDEAASIFEVNTLLPLRLSVMVSRMYWRHRRPENLKANRNIINISSTAGLKVYDSGGQSVYGASKAALNALTMHMASEFSKFGIRANAVAPNSFPQLLPTSRVVEEILRLDSESDTGSVICMDADYTKPVAPQMP